MADATPAPDAQPPRQGDRLLTFAEIESVVGDDAAYWLRNPFLGPDAVEEKVRHWITRAVEFGRTDATREAFALGAAWALGDDEESPAALKARAEEAECHVEQLRDARDRAERRTEAFEGVLAEVKWAFDLQCPPGPRERYVDKGALYAHSWWNTVLGGILRRAESGGVGTGAGEGATGQDTGTAWVTRSTDCPEARAQAHPLDPELLAAIASVTPCSCSAQRARAEAAEAEVHNLSADLDRCEERLWRLAAIAGWRPGNPADNNATAELWIADALAGEPGCDHEWLDRPESDTRECLICGTEVSG